MAIRPYSVWAEGRKVATLNASDDEIKNAGELCIIDGGEVGGFSSGAVTTATSIDTIILVEGTPATQRFVESLMAGRAVNIQLGVIDGKVDKRKMWITSAKRTCSHENGTLKGAFSLVGGAPTLT
jgi:hypothetical protein